MASAQAQGSFAPSLTRKIIYGAISIAIGILTFLKVTEVSGPAFEPIIEACTNPDIPIEDFAARTGYHEWEPKVGLGAFNVLVCLITQFLLELRETYPSGMLVWCSIVVISLATSFVTQVEAGRVDAKKISPIRFPIIVALLFQLFGISVMFPLVWVPSFIFGYGTGPISKFRLQCLIPMLLPGIVLTAIVFTASTDSYVWILAAGMLGGPVLALFPVIFWTDKSPPQTRENKLATVKGSKASVKFLTPIAAAAWYVLVFVAFKEYDSIGEFCDGIWVKAGPSVRFMTIDAFILYVAMLLWVAFHSELIAIKALFLTFLVGPGSGPLLVLNEIEEMKLVSGDLDKAKKDE